MNKEEAIKETNRKLKELELNLHSRCGFNYPHKTDKEGWEIYGRLQGLAWVIVNILGKLKNQKGMRDKR